MLRSTTADSSLCSSEVSLTQERVLASVPHACLVYILTIYIRMSAWRVTTMVVPSAEGSHFHLDTLAGMLSSYTHGGASAHSPALGVESHGLSEAPRETQLSSACTSLSRAI